MSRLLLITTFLLLASCTDQSAGNTLVLRYTDFGPPSAAHELIGMDWWQWMEHGDSRPTNYDIRVIVYRDTDLAQVQKKYPTDPSSELDYRYVRYTDAMNYLDRMIEENVFESLTMQLQATRLRILKALHTDKRRVD
jgi:hypothetical protein